MRWCLILCYGSILTLNKKSYSGANPAMFEIWMSLELVGEQVKSGPPTPNTEGLSTTTVLNAFINKKEERRFSKRVYKIIIAIGRHPRNKSD